MPERQWRTGDALDAEPMQANGDAGDVDDRVHRADFVEVHVVDVGPVHARFGGRERLEDRQRPVAHAGHQLRARDQSPDFANRTPVIVRMLVAPVMMVLVVIRMDVQELAVAVHAGATGSRLRQTHFDVVGVERTARDSLHVELEREVETSEVRFERALRESEVEQRTEQHVPRDAREGVEVQDSRSRIHVVARVRVPLLRSLSGSAAGASRSLLGLSVRGG